MNKTQKLETERKIYTTHCHPAKRPRLIGQPVIVNGERAIAYMKDGQIESYIPRDEAAQQIFKSDLPTIRVGF